LLGVVSFDPGSYSIATEHHQKIAESIDEARSW